MQVSPDSFFPPWMDMSPIESAQIPIPSPSTNTLPVKEEDASPPLLWKVIYRPPGNSSTTPPREPFKASENLPTEREELMFPFDEDYLNI